MNTVHVLVRNHITVENGEIAIIREIMNEQGFFHGDKGLAICICRHNSLNEAYGLAKERLDMSMIGVEHEEEFYTRYGCEPFEYLTLIDGA